MAYGSPKSSAVLLAAANWIGATIDSWVTTPGATKGNAMNQITIACTAAIGAVVILNGSAVAHANPATPMPVIESSAKQLCSAINADPTEDGVFGGMARLAEGHLDEMDGALVLLTAVHHVCPQHEELMMSVIDPMAAEELCGKPA